MARLDPKVDLATWDPEEPARWDKGYEDQETWQGGWTLTKRGRLRLRAGA